jgi:hypothetical protein
MWEPRRLTALWASMARHKDSCHEDSHYGILAYGTVQTCKSSPRFRSNMPPPSTGYGLEGRLVSRVKSEASSGLTQPSTIRALVHEDRINLALQHKLGLALPYTGPCPLNG